jgi:hypothetical protein
MKPFFHVLMGAAVVSMTIGIAAAQTPADRYAQQARAHKAMAGMYIGNPNHPMTENMANHCRQLAKLAEANAERVRVSGQVEEAVVPAPPAARVVGRSPSPSH